MSFAPRRTRRGDAGQLGATEAALAETKSALIEANVSLADARAKLAERERGVRPAPFCYRCRVIS